MDHHQVEIQPRGAGYLLRTEQRLSTPLDRVFEFFADAHNLQEITPPYLRFRILTPQPIDMQVGRLIEYRLRLHNIIPIYWQTEITAWEPPHRFVDEQRKGPYLYWIHQHQFYASGKETVAVDEVRYRPRFARLTQRWLVARDLRDIFNYRAQKLARLLV